MSATASSSGCPHRSPWPGSALDRRAWLRAAAALSLTPRLSYSREPEKAGATALNYLLASALYGEMPLEVVAAQVKQAGATAIDLWPKVHGNQREQVDQMGPPAFATLLEQEGVRLGGIACYRLGPFRLASELELVRQLGARDVVLVTGAGTGKGLRGPELDLAVADFVERLKPVAQQALAAGCIVAIENHGSDLLESEVGIRRFVDRLTFPGLKLAFAPHHLPQDAELLARLIRDVGPAIGLFYAQQRGLGFHEARPKQEELLQMPGRGPLDFGPLMQALRDVSYAGPVEIFMHPVPRGVPILDSADQITAEVNRARQYLEDCYRTAP